MTETALAADRARTTRTGSPLAAAHVPLRTEPEGRQDYDWATQRAWKVVNPNVPQRLGHPGGYKLVPAAASRRFFDPGSPVLRSAPEVIGHTLWVTPDDPDERWPGGEFVNQSARRQGLPGWTAADRSIEDTDVVLWYTFGIHHVTRPEDWPVMPADIVSFWLKPVGFFDRNPALDVAPVTYLAACQRPVGARDRMVDSRERNWTTSSTARSSTPRAATTRRRRPRAPARCTPRPRCPPPADVDAAFGRGAARVRRRGGAPRRRAAGRAAARWPTPSRQRAERLVAAEAGTPASRSG